MSHYEVIETEGEGHECCNSEGGEATSFTVTVVRVVLSIG